MGAADPVAGEDAPVAEDGQPLLGVEAGLALEPAHEPAIDRNRGNDPAENSPLSADDGHRSGGGARRRPTARTLRPARASTRRLPASDARTLTTVARCQRSLNARSAGESARGELGPVELLTVGGEGWSAAPASEHRVGRGASRCASTGREAPGEPPATAAARSARSTRRA